MSDEDLKDKIVQKFAQKLASNESKVRNRSVKKFRNWLSSKSNSEAGFTEKELLKLWKGLHYCMWMCDKPLVQQELSESLSKLLHVFVEVESALQFLSAFLKTQAREWFTTDRLRLDKFMMLIRMFIHETFVLLQNHEWKLTHIQQLNSILTAEILPVKSDQVPDGLKYHIISMYFDELAKVGSKQLMGEALSHLLQPFMDVILVTESDSLRKYVVKYVFMEILKQATKKVLEAQDTNDVSSDDMETEENEKEKDNTLQFDCKALCEKMFELASQKKCAGKNRASVYDLVKRFKKVSEGILEPTRVEEDSPNLSDTEEKQALNKLFKFEDNIVQRERKWKTEKKKRKKQKGKGSEGEQEEPASKRQKVETPPLGKKSKNKFKDGASSISKKGLTKSGKHSSHEENTQESNTDGGSFTGGYSSDDESEDDLNFGASSPENSSISSKKKADSGKKTKKEKKKKKVLNTETTFQSGSDVIFEGGFMSSDDEDGQKITETVTQKSSSKKTKKKKKSLESGSDLTKVKVLVNGNGSTQVDEEHLHSKKKSDKLSMLSSDMSDGSGKKKKKKRKSTGDLDTSMDGTIDNESKGNLSINGSADESTVSSMGKKSRKKKREKVEDPLGDEDNHDDNSTDRSVVKEYGSEEEVEIFIPNKKYKGKYKDWALQQANVSLNGVENVSPNCSSKGNESRSSEKKKKALKKAGTLTNATPFATFDKLLGTPPAFVKKSVLKSATPQTDPRHNKKKASAESTALSERRVSFGLHRNEMQSTKDYSDSIKNTPDVPFNPAVHPETGILKATPKSGSAKGKKKRPKAADFF